MSSILEARNKIEVIDQKLIDLFKERLEAVKVVLDYKKENNLEVFDPVREKDLYKKNVNYLNDSDLEKYYKIFFEGILNSSKEFQKDNLWNTLL